MILLNGALTPGLSVFQDLPGISLLSDEGLRRGAFFALRLTALVLLASLLTLTTSPLDLADGLERLLGPARRVGVPVHDLAMTLTIALRFVPTLADEAERLRRAQLSRGADIERGITRRIRGMTSLLVPLFLSAFRRADRLAMAMEARCYRGEEGRSHFSRMRFGTADAVAALVALTSAGAMWCFR